jgi:hypothetical protein
MALEFKQARLLAEGFAQACVHHDWWYTDYLTGAEKLSKRQVEPPLPLSACVDLARANEKIRNCSSPYYHMQKRKVTGEMCLDLEPARDGVMKNAGPDLLRVAARYRVDPNDLDRATAELQNTAGKLYFPMHNCLSVAEWLIMVSCSTGSVSDSRSSASAVCLRI